MLPWIGAMLLSPAEAASAVMLSAGSLGLGVDVMLPVGSVPVVLSISDSPIQWVIVPTTVPDRDYNLFVAPAAHRVGAELSWCHPKLRSWCAARLGLAWKSPDVALRTRGDILVGSADRVYHDSQLWHELETFAVQPYYSMIFRTPGSGLSAQLEVGTIWTGLPSWSTISSEGHPTEQLSQEHELLTEYFGGLTFVPIFQLGIGAQF